MMDAAQAVIPASMWMRRIVRVITAMLIAALLLAAVAILIIGPYFFRTTVVEKSPKHGYHADFFLYIPATAEARMAAGKRITLLVQPNNSGVNSDDERVHWRDAWWTGFERKAIADELGVVLLVPAFVRPARDWHIYSHALDRDVLTTTRTDLARLDLQLLAMVSKTRELLNARGFRLDEKFLLQGFSASGMFANRFAALHPQHLKAVAVGSPGGWPIAPQATAGSLTLNYPAGVADLRELTGNDFHGRTFARLPQFLILGALDDNDSLKFSDGWEPELAAQVASHFGDTPIKRWLPAQKLYQDAGVAAQFELVPDVAHDRKALQGRMTRFFAEVLAKE